MNANYGFAFAINLVFFQLGDVYLIKFIPFVAIMIAMNARHTLRRLHLPLYGLGVVIFVMSALWTWNILVWFEGHWVEAEKLRQSGIHPSNIACERMTNNALWVGYHQVQDFTDSVDPTKLTDNEDFWIRWNRGRRDQAEYWITIKPPNDSGDVINTREIYSLRHGGYVTIYTLRRRMPSP